MRGGARYFDPDTLAFRPLQPGATRPAERRPPRGRRVYAADGRERSIADLVAARTLFGLAANAAETEEQPLHIATPNQVDPLEARQAIETLGDEAFVEPDDVLGVAEGMFPRTDRCDPICPPGTTDPTKLFGTYAQMVADVRAMGAGHVRRLKFCDIYWGSVFPADPFSLSAFQAGVRVPPPNEILIRLRADGYQALAYLGDFLDECLLNGVRISLTPFNSGGGNPLSIAVGALAGSVGPNPSTTWSDILRGRPSHHKGVRAPSEYGWDEWYWALANRGTSDERLYQQYAINVWPTRVSDTEPSASAYSRECARRKGLGIAAFATGVAEYLKAYDAALRQWSEGALGVEDIVEFIELGNELDGLYVLPAHVSSQVEEPVTDEDELAILSEREAGRYMALIAGPFRRRLPQLRFRAAELLSGDLSDARWNADGSCTWSDLFRNRCEFLREAVRTGMEEETLLWESLQRASMLGIGSVPELSSQDYSEWRATCDSAGFFWPPLPFQSGFLAVRARDLVHELGFHWYYMHDWRVAKGVFELEPWLYGDESRLGDAIDTFRSDVITPLISSGFDVRISVGEIAFPATWPLGLTAPKVQAPYYQSSNEKFQAAMLVRRLLVLRAKGVAHAYWFCHYLKPAIGVGGFPSTWGSEFQGTGLRNDVSLPQLYDEFQSMGAYARPAWFAFRRLVWLLGHARLHGGVAMPVCVGGRTAIRVTFRYPLREGPDGRPLRASYRYAWVLWVDQYSDSTCLHASPTERTESTPAAYLVDSEDPGYEFLSLIPEVYVDFAAVGTGPNGYKEVSGLDWTWGSSNVIDPAWRAALRINYGEVSTDEGTFFQSLILNRTHPTDVIAPLCVLTNAGRIVFQ